ncbi:MAG: FAD-dependent thymidylate synthase [Cyanobacteriota bacterium]
MDSLFNVVVLNQTPDPERVIWLAMHQDYSPGFVSTPQGIPERYGEAVVKHLLEGNRGHYGPLEHPQITFGVGYFPHTVMQQARTHRIGISFDVQSFRYTGQQIADLGKRLLETKAGGSLGATVRVSGPEALQLEELFYVPWNVREGKAQTRQGVKVISPLAVEIILEQYRNQAIAYYRLVEECGVPYEDARNIIGYGIRQHFVVSFNCRSLMHFLDLRAKEDAQLEIRQLCELIWPHFEAWCPHIAAWYRKNRWGKAKLSP